MVCIDVYINISIFKIRNVFKLDFVKDYYAWVAQKKLFLEIKPREELSNR